MDNNNRCVPIEPSVDWDTLSDANRGQNSFLTWLYDQDNTGHTHEFEVSGLMNRLYEEERVGCFDLTLKAPTTTAGDD